MVDGLENERPEESLGNGSSGVAPRAGGKLRAKILALALLGAALGLGIIVWYVVIPYPWSLRDRNPPRTAVMEQRLREGRTAGNSLDIRQDWVTLDQISPRLVRAVIVAEDYRFRQHHGVDWVSLAEEVHWTGDDSFSWYSPSDWGALAGAVDYAWEHKGEIRGRSTVTQQLAKNLYFSTDRSVLRKAVEFIVAGRLERRLGKDRILELYLNVAEWGPGIFGAEEASWRYFGHSASSLTLDEAATLAATLPQPLTSNPAHHPARMLWRKGLILGRLRPSTVMPIQSMSLPEPGIEPEVEMTPPEPEPMTLAPPQAASFLGVTGGSPSPAPPSEGSRLP